MACTDTEEIDALYSVERGNVWDLRWYQSDDEDLSAWDAGTVAVQIRTTSTETGTLVASSDDSDESETVALIDTTGTTFGDGESALLFKMADSLKLGAGLYWVEVKAERDGEMQSFIPPRAFRVTDRVVV